MADRLRLWLAGFSVGRYEKPQYAHPGELKADIRKVLADLDRYREALADKHRRTGFCPLCEAGPPPHHNPGCAAGPEEGEDG